MNKSLLKLLLVCTPVVLTGCNWFVPLAFILPDTKKVPAEYAKLEDQKVMVLLWAEPETLYDYPYVRYELGEYIGDKIRANVDGVQVVNERKIEDHLHRHPEAAMDPEEVGEHFGAQMVVYIELLEFQIRDPEAPDLLQGKVEASIRIHDLTGESGAPDVQELESVSVTCPDNPMLYTATAPIVVRNETYKLFAEEVARKFYEHEEKL
ncbi:MAG: hypothetical protein ACE5GE_14420 [Phycisphaerae bacterium]